ncbi:DNA cytosine methyltransferase [Neorhizobium galegae]|uniref:DNA cytosine methyltransferase n=1 Tax=Neorhizobium galegae TaxID=399 RepID=UPI00390635AE
MPSDAHLAYAGEDPGFPDSWEFVGGKQSVARQIGNAVPAKLAQAVGLALVSAKGDVPLDF